MHGGEAEVFHRRLLADERKELIAIVVLAQDDVDDTEIVVDRQAAQDRPGCLQIGFASDDLDPARFLIDADFSDAD